MKNNNTTVKKFLKPKGMLRTELMQFLGPKEMVVLASLNRATYQIVDPNRDLF